MGHVEILRHCVAFNTSHKNRMDTEGWWGMGLGTELNENRCNLFVLPSSPLMAGVTLCQAAQCLLSHNRLTLGRTCWGNKRDLIWAGWERGRIAVNTSSNDLHNIQPYSSLICPPYTEGWEGGGGIAALIKHYSVNLWYTLLSALLRHK